MVDGSVRGGDFSWPPVGTFRGHQRGPHLATSGDFLMATDIGSGHHPPPNLHLTDGMNATLGRWSNRVQPFEGLKCV